MAATPPPYAPNVVNQTVDYGGVTWKGQPGGGWTAQSMTGGAPVSGGGGGMTDYAALARQQLQMQQEANLPAVQSLEASIPETSARFATQRGQLEAEREPLTARYARLLKDITSRTELASAREFGRRGIPLSSGLYETTLAERIEPQTERIGLEREGGLRDLTNLIAQLTGQETEATRAIRNAIAQLKAGGAGTGIQNALQMYLAQQAQQQEQAKLAFQAEQERGLREAQTGYYNALAQGKISSAGVDPMDLGLKYGG